MKKLTAILALSAGFLIVSPSLAAAQAHHRTLRATPCVTKHGRTHRRNSRCSGSHAHVAVAALSSLGTTPGPAPSHAVICDRFASTTGSDTSGDGSSGAPFASLQKLDQALAPGQTGCLDAGTYGSLTTWHQILSNGAPEARITISSAPGQTAMVVGWVDIEGSYTTLENLRIDGSNTLYGQHPAGVNCRPNVSQPLTVVGHDDTLQHLDYFQSVPELRGNAIGVGFLGTDADGTVIRYNEIHDVGSCDFYDHLIYLAGGNGARIYDNWMWNDAHGWGIKLDPGPTNARIWGNVIDHAGSGFMLANSSGARPTADNRIFDNIVMNSVGVDNPDINWSHPGVMASSPGMLSTSTGNRIYSNDSYHNSGGATNFNAITSSQISVTNDTATTPHFADAAAHNYTLISGSLTQMRGMVRR